jgi:hypothetical protein
MIVSDLQATFQKLTMPNGEDVVKDAYTGDLLSDVMGNAPSDSILITIQAHKNTIAVASLAGIKAIIVCNNRAVPADMKMAAEEEEISIFTTGESQFFSSYTVAAMLGKVDAHKA